MVSTCIPSRKVRVVLSQAVMTDSTGDRALRFIAKFSQWMPALIISHLGDWISISLSSPISPFCVRSIISRGQRLTIKPWGVAMGILLCLTASKIRRPEATLCPSGFSTRIALSGIFKASSVTTSCEGGYVLTHTTSVGQVRNISWKSVNIRTSEYFRLSSTPISGRRSAKATSLKYSEAATASRLSRPPVPPPTTLTLNWFTNQTQELKHSRSRELKKTSLHRAGCGSGTRRLRRKIPLLFGKESLRTVCFDSSILIDELFHKQRSCRNIASFEP